MLSAGVNFVCFYENALLACMMMMMVVVWIAGWRWWWCWCRWCIFISLFTVDCCFLLLILIYAAALKAEQRLSAGLLGLV